MKDIKKYLEDRQDFKRTSTKLFKTVEPVVNSIIQAMQDLDMESVGDKSDIQYELKLGTSQQENQVFLCPTNSVGYSDRTNWSKVGTGKTGYRLCRDYNGSWITYATFSQFRDLVNDLDFIFTEIQNFETKKIAERDLIVEKLKSTIQKLI